MDEFTYTNKQLIEMLSQISDGLSKAEKLFTEIMSMRIDIDNLINKLL